MSYDSDVADMAVLARAEAALDDEAAVPSLMRDDEPEPEPEREPERAPDVPDAPAPEAPAPPARDDVGQASGPPAPPPKRERRHGQVKRRRRS